MLHPRHADEERTPIAIDEVLLRGRESGRDTPVEGKASGESPADEECYDRHNVLHRSGRLRRRIGILARLAWLAHRHRHAQLDERQQSSEDRQNVERIRRNQAGPDEPGLWERGYMRDK